MTIKENAWLNSEKNTNYFGFFFFLGSQTRKIMSLHKRYKYIFRRL